MSRKDFFNTINMLYQAVRRSVGNSFGEVQLFHNVKLIHTSGSTHPESPYTFEYEIGVQLTGMSIYLNPNGTYFLNDTTEG